MPTWLKWQLVDAAGAVIFPLRGMFAIESQLREPALEAVFGASGDSSSPGAPWQPGRRSTGATLPFAGEAVVMSSSASTATSRRRG
jgi:hypothetical protein